MTSSGCAGVSTPAPAIYPISMRARNTKALDFPCIFFQSESQMRKVPASHSAAGHERPSLMGTSASCLSALSAPVMTHSGSSMAASIWACCPAKVPHCSFRGSRHLCELALSASSARCNLWRPSRHHCRSCLYAKALDGAF